MKFSSVNTIAASPETVWAGLNDPEILQRSLPGCESLEQVAENKFKATIVTKIGPISARFNGNVEVCNLNPPKSYTLSGSGSAGSMGNAKGRADVSLTPQNGATELSYEVNAEVTGKIAQLGSRLIESTARVLAGQFFNRFANVLIGDHKVTSAEAATAFGWYIAGAAVLVALIGIAFFLLS